MGTWHCNIEANKDMENQNFVNQINVNSQPLTIGALIEDNDIQWKEEASSGWDHTEKSRFIESLLLRLPTPGLYFLEKDNNSWEIIDGRRRMSTLREFISGEMVLQNLEFFKELNGKRFQELSRPLQRRIRTFPLVVHIVSKGLPEVAQASLIRRIKG